MRGMVIGTVVFMVVGALLHVCGAGERYVYVRDGVVVCEPRGLPSVGVDRTTGQVVAGLHGGGIYRVGLTGLQFEPPYDVELFDARVFGRWLEQGEMERVHANGVQELVRRGLVE